MCSDLKKFTHDVNYLQFASGYPAVEIWENMKKDFFQIFDGFDEEGEAIQFYLYNNKQTKNIYLLFTDFRDEYIVCNSFMVKSDSFDTDAYVNLIETLIDYEVRSDKDPIATLQEIEEFIKK